MRRFLVILPFALLVACGSTDPQVTRGTSAPVAGESATSDSTVPDDDTDTTDTTEPSDSSDTSDAPVERGSIDWHECDDDDYPTEVECGELDVPFDYDDPSGETITLALTRLPASGDAAGSILLNPGGPGGSGNDFLALDVAVDPSSFGSLSESFDFVGFDPRGVGGSSPIDCVDDAWLDSHEFDDPTPETPEEIAQAEASTTEFAAGCVDNTSGLAEYDTLNTARDMDRIREAVGDDRLTFYGASYGTFLGGVYATLFPDNVRALVLDGAVYQTGLDFFESNRIQLLGFEKAFDNWATECEANESCPFHAADVSARWLALRGQLDAAPAPAKDGRLANERALVDATLTSMYLKDLWGPLAGALASAEVGDGTALVGLTDFGNEREADGTWSNLTEAFPVISCTSGLDGPTTGDDLEARVAELLTEAPHFAPGLTAEAFGASCEGLPTAEPTTISYSGTAPILVIGGENDPATPLVWAGRLQTALGDTATVLTYTGEGHTALHSSSCVTAAVEQVLGDAEQVDADTECDPDPPTPAPDWFADLPDVPVLTAFPLEDAAKVFGFESGTYVTAFSSTSDRDGVSDSVSEAFDAAGWTEEGRQDVPVVDDLDATAMMLSDGDHELQVYVFGPDVVASPDFGTIGALLPTGASLTLYIVY